MTLTTLMSFGTRPCQRTACEPSAQERRRVRGRGFFLAIISGVNPQPGDLLVRLLTIILILAVLFTPVPAQAHTRDELDEYMVAWVVEADTSFNLREMVAEFEDMTARHPWYFDPQPATTRASSTSRARSTWSGNVEQWRLLVAAYFVPEKVNTAMCILNHETGGTGNPNADNPRSSAAGLFQFLRKTWNRVPLSVTGGSYDSGMVYDPEANVAAAAWLQSHSGWGQWTVYPLCRGL